MRSHWKTWAVALAGAVALASAAYGIGTEVGGGTASAARDNDNNGTRELGPPGRGFDGLADKLGVDADELRNALMDFGEQQHAKREDDFAQALAGALGKPVDDVQAALDKAEGRRGGRRGLCGPDTSLRNLAKALDVTPAELRKAMGQVHENEAAEHQARRDDLVNFLADRFNLSKDKVEQALPDLAWPPAAGHRFRGPGGPGMPPPPDWPAG